MQRAKQIQKKSKRSRQARRRDAAARLAAGLPKERLAFLNEIKARVAKGFYNTEPVLDDLSYAFTKAVDALV